MSQSKSRQDISWPNDAECMGLCLVSFVMRIPTVLWCRVPSLPRWWLGVHIRLMYCTLLPATQEWKWAGLKRPDAQDIQVRGVASSPLIPHFSFLLRYLTDSILGNPSPEVVRNASLWGVKVGMQSVAWWAVCYRERLPLLGGVAMGAWMVHATGHGLCILSEVGFQPQVFET